MRLSNIASTSWTKTASKEKKNTSRAPKSIRKNSVASRNCSTLEIPNLGFSSKMKRKTNTSRLIQISSLSSCTRSMRTQICLSQTNMTAVHHQKKADRKRTIIFRKYLKTSKNPHPPAIDLKTIQRKEASCSHRGKPQRQSRGSGGRPSFIRRTRSKQLENTIRKVIFKQPCKAQTRAASTVATSLRTILKKPRRFSIA